MSDENEFKIEVSEEESVKILEDILKASRIPYRRTKPGEKGGFFYIDKHGRRKRFKGNIFVKRSLKYENKPPA